MTDEFYCVTFSITSFFHFQINKLEIENDSKGEVEVILLLGGWARWNELSRQKAHAEETFTKL